MKLKFKHQAYQAEAVQAVVDCFKGQLPNDAARHYKIDPGAVAAGRSGSTTYVEAGFKNAEIQLSEHNCWPIFRRSKPGRICLSPAHSMTTEIGMAKN